MNKKKLLIIHPALAPYRIDYFNKLAELFEVEIIFLYKNLWNHQFDQTFLLQQLRCNYSFLLKGPSVNGRVIRYGILDKIKLFNPDIVFSYEFSFTTLILLFFKKTGVISMKIGTIIDDSLEICNNVQSFVRKKVRSFALSRLDYFAVLSNDVSLYFQNNFGINDSQIVVYPILQDERNLKKNYNSLQNISREYIEKYNLINKTVILFVGRLIPEKGLIQFLNNIIPVLQKKRDLIIVLVGDGNEKLIIQRFIDKNGFHQQIILPGRFEGSALHAWYLCSSGFVLPSIFEPFGAVVNEALIFGLKTFCSEKAGSSVLLNAHNGITFNPEQADNCLYNFLEFISCLEKVDKLLFEKKSLMDKTLCDYIINWNKIF